MQNTDLQKLMNNRAIYRSSVAAYATNGLVGPIVNQTIHHNNAYGGPEAEITLRVSGNLAKAILSEAQKHESGKQRGSDDRYDELLSSVSELLDEAGIGQDEGSPVDRLNILVERYLDSQEA